MSLYGRVDSTANQTAVGRTIGNSGGSVTKTIVFVDETEAGLDENKSRGITAPGWWAYHTYTDVSCLLYTSPSPRDATLSRMPSSA